MDAVNSSSLELSADTMGYIWARTSANSAMRGIVACHDKESASLARPAVILQRMGPDGRILKGAAGLRCTRS